jgi:hypothetical protein
MGDQQKRNNMDDNERFEDYDENATLCCANCGDTGCSGWYVLDTSLKPFIGFKGVFCSAECVCKYLDITFYNDEDLDKDSFK